MPTLSMSMLETIEAIYENGQFKPLSPVDLPEGTRVRVEPTTTPTSPDDQLRKQLVASGIDVNKANGILDNFHLLWDSNDSLSNEQLAIIEQARLDQQHFFDHIQ